jgi:hypothetical protein
MRISTPDSLWPRPKVVGGKESAKKDARRRGKTRSAEGSGQLLLINKTTKVQSKEVVAIQNEEHRERSRRVESPNGKSRHERSRREKSPHEESRCERTHREKSHQEMQHREKSHHGESHNNHCNEEVEDLKRKYALIARQIVGEDLKSTVWEMLDDENLPFQSE